MPRSWKIKGKGVNNEGERVFSANFFIRNNCVSCGWGAPALQNRDIVVDYQTYKEQWSEMHNPEHKWNNQGVHHLFESIKVGDFLWARLDGVYYVSQIPNNPINLFQLDFSEDAISYDCVVQLRDINWVRCGTEESVPGSVSAYSSNSRSLIRIDNNEEFVNGMTATSLFSDRIINPNAEIFIEDKKMILNLIGPSGFEDLVAIWLFDKYGYFVLPSTSKTSTQKYEFVLVNSEKINDNYLRRRIYIQVKNGNVDLRINDFKHLLGIDKEVWLVTSRGMIFDTNGSVEQNQIVRYIENNGIIESTSFDIGVLVDFVFDVSKHPILPDSILKFVSYF